MLRIKINFGLHENHLLRYIPDHVRIWKNCEFFINSTIKECDWWIVIHSSGLSNKENVICDPKNTVYLSLEGREKEMALTQKPFLDQFHYVITPDDSFEHKGKLIPKCAAWMIGVKFQNKFDRHIYYDNFPLEYNKLNKINYKNKQKILSIVVSKRNFLEGHKKRLKFIDEVLNSPLKELIDVFGEGYIPVEDKLDALSQYKYHLCIENDYIQNYWTEKIADPFIAMTMPFYYGCPNIFDFFPKESLLIIDIENPKKSIKIMMEAIESDAYEKAEFSIITARSLVMNEYNIINQITTICNSKSIDNSIEKNVLSLYPNRYFVDGKIKYFLKNIFNKFPEVIKTYIKKIYINAKY
jgi:hypothetical protein